MCTHASASFHRYCIPDDILFIHASPVSSFFPPSLYRQITVYLGKRDFVDHVTHVEPIGQSVVTTFFVVFILCGITLCFINLLWFLCFLPWLSPFVDGVVLVDSDYIKDRKVFGHVLAAFRYGREDLDVLGLTFRKDLYLASSQIYPMDPANKRPPTRLQVCVSLLIHSHTTFLEVSLPHPAPCFRPDWYSGTRLSKYFCCVCVWQPIDLFHAPGAETLCCYRGFECEREEGDRERKEERKRGK